MAASERPSRPSFPRVYEVCLTCGYDHSHDLPHLDARARAAAEAAHLAAEWDAIDDAASGLEPSDSKEHR